MLQKRILIEAEVRLPRPPAPLPSPLGFAVCPAPWLEGMAPEQLLWTQNLYLWAFALAQEVARPSLPERDLAAAWN